MFTGHIHAPLAPGRQEKSLAQFAMQRGSPHRFRGESEPALETGHRFDHRRDLNQILQADAKIEQENPPACDGFSAICQSSHQHRDAGAHHALPAGPAS